MKLLKPIIILPLFCIMFCVYAGMGHIVSGADNGADVCSIISTYGNTGTLQDSTEDYMRIAKSGSFVAAPGVNNTAARVPVQYLRTAQNSCAQKNCVWNLKRVLGQRFANGVKALIFGDSGLLVPYHKIVSVLGCDTFSKCYVLALGKQLC